jgi:hypothetical protein
VGDDFNATAHHLDTAVWRASRDGHSWSRVVLPKEKLLAPGDRIMNAVVSTRSGVVAVGRDPEDAAVWQSPDGIRWSRVHSVGFDGAAGTAEIKAIAAGGPGLVAAGWTQTTGGDRDAAVWTFDGADWQLVHSSAFQARGPQEATSIAVTAGGILVGGFDGSGSRDAALWFSRDGTTWRRVPTRALRGDGDQTVDAMVGAGGARALLAGNAASARLTDQDAALWSARVTR